MSWEKDAVYKGFQIMHIDQDGIRTFSVNIQGHWMTAGTRSEITFAIEKALGGTKRTREVERKHAVIIKKAITKKAMEEVSEDLLDTEEEEYVEATVMAIVPLTIETIRQAAPWIVQQIVVQGLKALSVAELLEMVSGQEFYSLDDVLAWVVSVLRGAGDGAPTPFMGPVGRGADPKDFNKGAVREGWYVKEVEDYDYGKKTSKKVWYKPYEDASRGKTGAVMNFREKCAYFQGKRVQAYDSRQAKYRAYKRGYGHGSGDQFMAQAIMGHTRPCAPQLFYTKGRGRGMGVRRY